MNESSLAKTAEVAQPQGKPLKATTVCSPVATSLSSSLGGAVKSCIDVKPLAGSKATASTRQAAAALNDSCDITQPGLFTATRSGICLNGSEVTYTLLNNQNVPVGTGLMNVATSMTLSASKTTWDETTTVTVLGVTGQVTSLNVSYDVSCDGGCSMSDARPWDGIKTLGRGATASGTVTYSAPVSAGGLMKFKSKHHMYVVSSGAIPVQPNVSWDNPWDIRCDNQVSANPGCVVPDIRANFEFSTTEFKAAAATYGWAQFNLRSNAPLTRDSNTGAAEARRNYTCGSNSLDPFVYLDEVPDDSCDEFPFASSFEGGTTGAMCADILPLFENGEWWIYEARADKPVTFTEPCVRGHVPNTDNGNAGLALGRYVQRDRVLDVEKYDISVVV